MRWCCLVTMAALAMAAAPARAEDDVSKNKAAYQKKLQEIRQETDAAKVDLVARYRKGLDALRLAGKQKGDLDAVQAVDEEIKRFDKQKNLPPATPPPASADLAKNVTAYREAMDKADLDGARKVVDLTDRYVQFLDKHVKDATREDKLEVARAFNAELKAVPDTPEYQAAKFLIADKTATTTPPKADPGETTPADPSKNPPAAATNAPPPPLAPTRNGPNGEKIAPRVDPEGLYDAARVTEGTPSVTLGTPTSYKQLSSSETGKAPLTGGVGISMDGYLDAENARYQLRFKLRTKSSGANFANLKVLVQYFCKNPSGGSIQEANTQLALIPKLGAKGLTCEMKSTDLPFAYTYRFRGGNFVEDRDGAFMGAIISVFSPEDKLLGQVTSAPALKERGKTSFELPKSWEEHSFEVPAGMQPPVFVRPRRHPQPADRE